MLDLRESWEWSTKEERRDLVSMMIHEVSVDVATKQVVWEKARPDFDVPFLFLHNIRADDRQRYWIVYSLADDDICDIGDDVGQMSTGVKIAFPMSHNTLTRAEEYM